MNSPRRDLVQVLQLGYWFLNGGQRFEYKYVGVHGSATSREVGSDADGGLVVGMDGTEAAANRRFAPQRIFSECPCRQFLMETNCYSARVQNIPYSRTLLCILVH